MNRKRQPRNELRIAVLTADSALFTTFDNRVLVTLRSSFKRRIGRSTIADAARSLRSSVPNRSV